MATSTTVGRLEWLGGVLLVLLLQCNLCMAAMKPTPFGSLKPHGQIHKRIGEDLRFICNLYKPDVHNNSINLTFTKNGEAVDPQFVTRLNYSAIQLLVPNAPQMKAVFTCKLNSKGVGLAEVYVGSAPRNVSDFRCISNNWQRLNCTFNFAENFIHTRYTIQWKAVGYQISYYQDLEPFTNATQPVYWFVLADGYTPVIQHYTMTLEMHNRFGNQTQVFEVDNYASVRPNPPISIVAKLHPDRRNVTLTWKTSHNLNTFDGYIVSEISYFSVYDQHIPPILVSFSPNETYSYDLHNLTAFTLYSVQIRMRTSRADPKKDDLWSDHKSATFKTLPRIPDRPPETDIGAFSVNDLNDVVVFWKTLADYEANAENPGYKISKALVGGRHRELHPATGTTMARVKNMGDQTIEFWIRSSNMEGVSQDASYVKVPRRSERPPYPTELKKNRHGSIYTLTWREPTHRAEEITSYTIFWCKSKSELANQCEGSIEFQRVNSNVREYTVNTTEGINFAVSANTHNSSSGMVWALCTASESDDIGKLKTIWTAINATSMEIKWNLECVDAPILKAYNITYCPITTPKNLTCREGTEQHRLLPSGPTHYTITGLLPYTTYRTIIRMISATRVGPPSEPQINTTLEATPSEPLNLRHGEIKNDSVLLYWDPPERMNGVLKNYEIWYNNQRKDVYEIKSNATLLTGLSSFTNYEIVVRACSNCCNCSMGSNKIYIRTDIGPPGVVEQIQKADNPKEKVLFDWKPPMVRAGNVDYYQVSIHYSENNETKLANMTRTRCFMSVGTMSDLKSEHQWTLHVRAVNVIWSPHSDEFSKEAMRRNLYENRTVQPSDDEEYKPCEESDEEIMKRLAQDKHRQEFPGPLSSGYTYIAASSIPWLVVLAIAICVCFGFGLVLYFCQKWKSRRKGDVVLPPGLTDIAVKPEGKKGGGGGLNGGGIGGLLDHGSELILPSDSHQMQMQLHGMVDQLYDSKGGNLGKGGLSPHMTFEDHHRQIGSGAVGAGGVIQLMGQSETNSINEQEQSLLEDRGDVQSNASSSSMMLMIEHEEGGILDGGSSSGCDEEEEGVLEQHEDQHSRLGLPHVLQPKDVLSVIGNNKPPPSIQPPPMQTAVPQAIIKPAANGYVTITQRSDGYTQLADLKHMAPPAQDKVITGYVTRRQLADYGQRMQ